MICGVLVEWVVVSNASGLVSSVTSRAMAVTSSNGISRVKRGQMGRVSPAHASPLPLQVHEYRPCLDA